MTNPHERSRFGRRGDRGVTVVFFAIALTAMLAVAGLVLGGSIGYTAVRNAQTAADAAALAGTGALQKHKQNWVDTPADEVAAEVLDVVEENGATLAPGGCDLVGADYALTGAEAAVIAACDQLEFLSEQDFEAVAGVRVSVSDTRDVPFAAFVDRDTITGGATAAATIQPVVRGRAPFMVCTSPDAVGHPAQALLPVTDPATGDVTDHEINQAAVGKHFVLWGNQIKEHGSGRDCGNPASDWRGLVQFDSSFALPSPSVSTAAEPWWGTESGNKNGNLPQTLAGSRACKLDGESVDSLELGCRIAIPLCPTGNGSTSDFRLYCVKLGAFKISYIGETFSEDNTPIEEAGNPCGVVTSNIICGEFLGGATAVGGRGVAETPDPHGVAVIKLVE